MTGSFYFSVLVLAFGACIGSFLNVIIYRWPRDLLARRPLWSFCPTCRHTLAWYDNIPVVSYLRLRGRCRYCDVPISVQYPLVEIATALAFLMIYDAFFGGRQRLGVGDLSNDWPILIAHWALLAGLIVLTVMDLEAYMIDIRVTWIVTLVGLLCHTLWTPSSSVGSGGWIRPGVLQSAMAIAVTLGLVVGMMLFAGEQEEETPEREERAERPSSDRNADEEGSEAAAEPAGTTLAGSRSRRWLLLIIPFILMIVYLAAMQLQRYQQPFAHSLTRIYLDDKTFTPQQEAVDFGAIRLGIGLGVLFLGLAWAAGHPHPDEDTVIVESIEAEAVNARRNALLELKLLLPVLVLLAAVIVFYRTYPAAWDTLRRFLHARPVAHWHWQPLWGLSTALVGWAIGGAVAWSARIFFTLIFGKEALGMGDVHILAATGAVAGWPVAFLGFFAAAPLALLALAVIHLRRQSRALPYGPWLALGFFVVMIYQDRILQYLHVRSLLE